MIYLSILLNNVDRFWSILAFIYHQVFSFPMFLQNFEN